MRRLLALLLGIALCASVAEAHSYQDPALQTVLDEVRPGLPAGASVSVRAGVLDELVLTNTTAAPLDVLGADGLPFLQVSASGVLANLNHPDWYATGVPEGSPALPAFARPGAQPRWARVSNGSSWSEFDPRIRPAVTVTPELRKAGQQRVLATWQVPLRYGGQPRVATGHVLLSPVRGGLVVAVTAAPPRLTATALQGELPGLFLRVPADTSVEVTGRDGLPFLRFAGGRVLANAASLTWREDQRARGHLVTGTGTGTGWEVVGRGLTQSWLDSRLRYPADVPPEDVVGRRTVVQAWRVPVVVGGVPSAITGTVTWVPRADAFATAHRTGRGWLWLLVLVPLGVTLLLRARNARMGQSGALT
jgi:hypothetical protein